MGKVPGGIVILVFLLLSGSSVTNFWELDVIGITDPTENFTKGEVARNEVRLPWLFEHSPLSYNYTVDERRSFMRR